MFKDKQNSSNFSEETISSKSVFKDLLLLGTRQKKSFLGKKSIGLKLEKEDALGNMWVSGVAGSGKSMSFLSYARQCIISGKGFLYFDIKGDPSLLLYIKKMVIEFNREEDLFLYTTENKDALNNLEVHNLIKSNKIVIVQSSGFKGRNDKNTYIINFLKFLAEKDKEGEFFESSFPYMIYVDEGDQFLLNFKAVDFIEKLNNKNIFLVLSTQCYSLNEKMKMFLNQNFKNQLFFKQESLISIEKESGFVPKDFFMLKAGEFIYRKNGFFNKHSYVSLYVHLQEENTI